jgi:hypothetical protein
MGTRVSDFLAQLEKEFLAGTPKGELEERAWAWFDTQSFPLEDENSIRKAIERILGLKAHISTPDARFTNLLDRELYPSSGWLAKYLKYTEFCGAPLVFHFYVGLSILGSALKREIWMPFGRHNVFPAIYVILVAPPGVCYKTTAVMIGVGILREMETVPIITGSATPEGLSNMLSTKKDEPKKDAICFIAAPELYEFLAGHNTPANSKIISAMTSWYDALDIMDDVTITRGDRMLYNVAISLCGGTTLDWLTESLPKTVFAGGFMSRVIFVVQEGTDRVWSISPPDDKLLRIELMEDLADIMETMKGPITLCEGAYEIYDKWFHKQHERLRTSDERHGDFFQRRADHVRKISLIIAASQKHQCVEIDDIKWAIAVLEMLDNSLESIITPISLGESGHDLDVIRRTIEKYKEIAHTDLIRKCSSRGIDSEKMARLINTLKEAGLVEQGKSGKRGGRYYKWTK